VRFPTRENKFEETMMDAAHGSNSDQIALWNGTSGRAWVDTQELLDQVLKPFEDLLVDTVFAGAGNRVLDVGCGTGSTTLAVARLLGQPGQCTGIDVSAPMIEVARNRAEREGLATQFICADAQEHDLAPESFDTIISRFGIMFFDDPAGAFANLRQAATHDAAMSLIAWRSAEENPFMTTAERAAAPLLPNIPPRRPNAPGQFSFADQTRVHGILAESGWADIDIQPIDVDCTFSASELGRYFTRLGPLGQVLGEVDDRTRARVVEQVYRAFDPYVHGPDVRFTAACWSIRAQAGAA